MNSIRFGGHLSKGETAQHTTDSNHDDPIAANVLARDFTAAAPHLEGPQLAGSHERTPDADPDAADRLETLVDEGRPYEIDPVNPSTESDHAHR